MNVCPMSIGHHVVVVVVVVDIVVVIVAVIVVVVSKITDKSEWGRGRVIAVDSVHMVKKFMKFRRYSSIPFQCSFGQPSILFHLYIACKLGPMAEG